MTVLVGQVGAGFANSGAQSTAGDATWVENSGIGYTATASGTAAFAKVNVAAWSGANSIKIGVYDSTRALLATSAVISSPTTGVVSGAISCSITSGQTYFLLMVSDTGRCDLVTGNSAFAGGTSQAITSYTTLPSTLPAASTSIGRESAIWLEDSGAAATFPPVPHFSIPHPTAGM